MSIHQCHIHGRQLRRVDTASAMLLALCLCVAGCKREPEQSHTLVPPSVAVSYPVQREVTDYATFTARTAAVDSVEVRARVWGYLEKVNFKEGSLVHKGDVLFEIDPRTYQAELAQAEASIAQAEARRANCQIEYRRTKAVFANSAASPQELDTATAKLAEADAAVAAATAARDLAKLNLAFTRVTAPVTGRVGRAMVTEGNLIQSGQVGGTVLTTIVSVDPIYAYFDVDEATVLRVKQLIREGRAPSAEHDAIDVWLSLANDVEHSHRGTINFIDNQVNPRTGTLRVRGVYTNADEALSPGFFGRVRVPIGAPHQALLITQRALDTDQGQKIVYVVDDQNRVVTRPVELGAMHDGLREITEGLKPTDRVIVNGIQQVRPGMTVEPGIVNMPASPASNPNQAASRQSVTFTH